MSLQATDTTRAVRAGGIKSGEAFYALSVQRQLFDTCRIHNIYFSNRYVPRLSAPSASREAEREWPKLQAGGPLAHELGDLRV